MDSTDTLRRKRIDSLKKLRHSPAGNPKYRVRFTDGTSAETATDSSIGNSENRTGDVLITFNRRGEIINVQPAQTSS